MLQMRVDATCQCCQGVLALSRDEFQALSVLERFQRRCGRHQAAQHNRTRHSDALVVQIELRDAVLTQRDERDPAEVGHGGVLEHHLCQSVGGLTRDVGEADTASQQGSSVQRALT